VTAALAAECGVVAAASPRQLVETLASPRVVWLMLPAGAVTEASVGEMQTLLAPGDVLVDGANSHYKDSIRRGAELAVRGIDFVDAGVSGGVWGLEAGYALMVGGTPAAVADRRSRGARSRASAQ
jgi:6-phosphogluconate dehydrogenase